PGAAMGRDLADLAGNDLETPAVKSLSQGQRYLTRAIPAEFDDLRLEPGNRERSHKTCAVPRRIEDAVEIIFQIRYF
ncbi:hypothetical protein, partial [Salmonella enterica]|uniref:hypothetical protein n=1 Tax=Salmonella enterica TaxID=28901 RepID=UPI0032B5149E